MKVLTVVGARPQFIKAAPVSKAIRREGYQEVLVHTGQHYDPEMSGVFFAEMGIPEPDFNLGVGSGSHGVQTGQMMIRLEEVVLREKPDLLAVYGDTNSTLAGALVACKLRIPLAHVEAGLRSFNRGMPEELNRVLTDHCADILFCPTRTAVENLAREGITEGVHLVGDTMLDAVLAFSEFAQQHSTILSELQIRRGCYLLLTLHRPYNTENPAKLRAILATLSELPETVIFPIHPRTRKKISVELHRYLESGSIRLIEPVGYLDILVLQRNARAVLTDSGGIQKEACFLKVPCITLRPETEWVETVESGWNRLVGADPEKIRKALVNLERPAIEGTGPFGDGSASAKIVRTLALTL